MSQPSVSPLTALHGAEARARSRAVAARHAAQTCGAFHGSGPSNFNGKLRIFHGYIPAMGGWGWWQKEGGALTAMV